MNALVKAPGNVRDKVVFVSASPCVMCAKLIINSGVTHVFYRKAYRDPSGIEVLQQGGVVPVLYDKWVREWREFKCGVREAAGGIGRQGRSHPPGARHETLCVGPAPRVAGIGRRHPLRA